MGGPLQLPVPPVQVKSEPGNLQEIPAGRQRQAGPQMPLAGRQMPPVQMGRAFQPPVPSVQVKSEPESMECEERPPIPTLTLKVIAADSENLTVRVPETATVQNLKVKINSG